MAGCCRVPGPYAAQTQLLLPSNSLCGCFGRRGTKTVLASACAVTAAPLGSMRPSMTRDAPRGAQLHKWVWESQYSSTVASRIRVEQHPNLHRWLHHSWPQLADAESPVTSWQHVHDQFMALEAAACELSQSFAIVNADKLLRRFQRERRAQGAVAADNGPRPDAPVHAPPSPTAEEKGAVAADCGPCQDRPARVARAEGSARSELCECAGNTECTPAHREACHQELPLSRLQGARNNLYGALPSLRSAGAAATLPRHRLGAAATLVIAPPTVCGTFRLCGRVLHTFGGPWGDQREPRGAQQVRSGSRCRGGRRVGGGGHCRFGGLGVAGSEGVPGDAYHG